MARPVKVWGLYSSQVGTCSPHELLEVFAEQADAEACRDGLLGNRVSRLVVNWVWEDDEDFPDLYVRPLDLH